MLTEGELRTLLVVAVGGAIVLAGEAIAIGSALGGGSLAAVVVWLGGSTIAAYGTVAYGSVGPGAARRLVEAAAAGLAVFPVVYVVDTGAWVGLTFGIAYAAAAGAGTALALPGRSPVRLAARLVAILATGALVFELTARSTGDDIGYLLPGLVVAAVGIADVVVDAVERGRMLLGAAVAVMPACLLVSVVLLQERGLERERREQRLAAQPAPATAGQERIAWMFPARGFNSGPLVVGNLVVADGLDAIFGIEARTGRQLWRLQLSGRDGLTLPKADGRRLFYPANLAGLHAIDLRDGQRLWRFAPSDSQLFGVVAHRSGIVAVAWETSGSALYGLEPETGARRWRRPLDGDEIDLLSRPGGALVETEHGRWLVDSRTGQLTPTGAAPAAEYTFGRSAALRSRSRGWLYRPGWEATTSEPLELDSRVFVNVDLLPPKANGGLYSLDRRTGKLRWRVEIPGDSEFKPAVRAGLVYVTSTGACTALGSCRSGLYAIRHR